MSFPVCLVYGEEDSTVPSFDEAILDQLRNCPVVEVAIIERAGHDSPTAQDPIIADIVASLINGSCDEATKGVVFRRHTRES